MQRKRILLLSHCLLNIYSKVRTELPAKCHSSAIARLLNEQNVGIIQLPCPELTCFGVRRWGHAYEQFDTPHYRRYCRQLFRPYLDQILDYQNNGVEVLGVIGVEGSPSCGVHKAFSGDWGGEISQITDLTALLGCSTFRESAGVFMQEMRQESAKRDVGLELLDFDETDPEGSLHRLKKVLHDKTR